MTTLYSSSMIKCTFFYLQSRFFHHLVIVPVKIEAKFSFEVHSNNQQKIKRVVVIA